MLAVVLTVSVPDVRDGGPAAEAVGLGSDLEFVLNTGPKQPIVDN